MKKQVLITCPQLQQDIEHYQSMLARYNVEIELYPLVQSLGESELLEIIDRFDGVIAGDDEFTSKVLTKGKRLKIISKWGIGVDTIDLDTANQLGIHVSNTPDMFSDEVADVVLGYLILLSRQLHKLDQSVRNGGWTKVRGTSLHGKTLGVIGVGHIGQAVIKRTLAMDMSVIGYDVNSTQEPEFALVGFKDLLQNSDFISLNCNLTPENHHMLGSEEFALMKEGVYIINTARGALIDEAALAQALSEGKVAGAALDVFEKEPLPLDSPLRHFETCIFGTHNSSNTTEAVIRVNEFAICNLLDGLEDGLT